MKNFEGFLICTDLDGTLLNDKKQISTENLCAIEHFKNNGGIFTFVTGRMPFFVSDILNAISPNAPIGCINGGGIYDHREGRYLTSTTLPLSVMELVEYAASKIDGIGVQVNHLDKIYFCKENSAMQKFREVTHVKKLTKSFNKINEPIAKIVFGDENEESISKLQEVLLEHPRAKEFDFIRSELTLFEIMPKGINKGAAISQFERLLSIERKNIIAIGDYNNDVEMLRNAGIGIAVANACEEAKAAADLITVSNNDHAIAKIIYDLEQGLI